MAAIFPPEPLCPWCLSGGLEWADSTGAGTVYTLSALHVPPSPGFPVPSVLAVIELDEGFSMFTDIIGCAPEDVGIGSRVNVDFEPASEAISLPLFRLAQTQG
jgi:uncharacterized protein